MLVSVLANMCANARCNVFRNRDTSKPLTLCLYAPLTAAPTHRDPPALLYIFHTMIRACVRRKICALENIWLKNLNKNLHINGRKYGRAETRLGFDARELKSRNLKSLKTSRIAVAAIAKQTSLKYCDRSIDSINCCVYKYYNLNIL